MRKIDTTQLSQLIPHRPKDQRYWVVRASSGQYLNHFLDANAVAIGHLDELSVESKNLGQIDYKAVKAALALKNPEKSKGTITSQVNQIKAFIDLISIGDLVITLDSNSLVVGRVISDAYVDDRPVVRHTRSNKKHEMRHRVRRRISWGPILSRTRVPAAVEVSLFAHQTVFNIDDHWQTIYHLLYPYFTYKDKLYLSTNISQIKALDNYSVAELFRLLSGAEAIARLMEADETSALTYQEIYSYFAQKQLFTLTSKAEFMSPGSIWSKVALTPKGMIFMCLVYSMLFGAEIPGVFKTDGIIDKELRHKLFDLSTQMKKTHDIETLNEKLKPTLPNFKTAPLEDNSKDQIKLANS